MSSSQERPFLAKLWATKAPGRDGFPTLFYQKFWSQVGPSVVLASLDYLNSGASMERLNDTLITLIPKKKVAVTVSDFRPISLCNVIYKIVAKTIANHFPLALDGVISEAQSAFIPGRLISDNVMLSFECLHRLKRSKRKFGSMAVKLDMAKAYDRVEWVFVVEMMRRLGFSEKWISLIYRCISSVSYSFFINGEISGDLKPSRGLRQGDPISSYLFLLCGEGLSCLINNVVSNGSFTGFKCSCNGPVISHLLFADDCMIFARASPSNCVLLQSLLGSYALASGQIINCEKSAFCVSPSVSNQLRVQLADILGIKVVDCHEQYLGLPCFSGRRKKALFAGIISRIWDKLKGWRDKFLSTGGKEILIKAIIQAIPTYSMNLFRLSKGIISEVYCLCARFWWGSSGTSRKMHWCNWSRLCESKERGGLGFRNLEVFNQSLLASQGWRILSNDGSLAARVLKDCYFPESSFIDAVPKSSASFLWKSLMWGKELLVAGSRWTVGAGTNIRIYKDCWLPRPTIFKPLSSPVLGELATVNQLITPSGSWNVELINSIFCVDDVTAILSIPLSRSRVKDSYQWHYDQTGSFTAKSGYKVGCSRLTDVESSHSSSFSSTSSSWWNSLWQLKVPTKIKFFVWRACNNMLPTNEALALRRVPVNKVCPLCHLQAESSLHSLWCCSGLKLVRADWRPKLQDNHKGKFLFFDFMIDCFSRLEEDDLGLLCVCIWKIWSIRNAFVHGSAVDKVEDVLCWARMYISEVHAAWEVQGRLPNPVPFRNPVWTPPGFGSFKINCDAAIRVSDRLVSYGIVIHNSTGLVMAASSQRVMATFSAQVAEAGAILHGLHLAREAGLYPCMVDSDAEVVVGWINSKSSYCSEIGTVLNDIRVLLNRMHCISVNFVSRKAIQVAGLGLKLGPKLGEQNVMSITK
ncbi:hypothetical protein LWI29_034297 [Acer saccharum]|uniref:Reverse transcriptase domain-containing protein n=1 Tax=Acer saccharum TaxID=4024 RepID=A0AA39RS97_ACESA|nr:hypothetical protein LWI29_034297 [Acer saccharum]